jgi:hypothetical protein
MWPLYLVLGLAAVVLDSLAVALVRGDFADDPARFECVTTAASGRCLCEEVR